MPIRGRDLPWASDSEWQEPELTLGWQIADWLESYLKVPGGDLYGQPMIYVGWQLMALADWYAFEIVGRRARWLYRRGQIRLAKGTGKSPWAAGAVCLTELCGPSVFDGLDAYGQPVAKPHPAPWVQIAAASEDQAGNTYSAFRAMLQDSPLLDEEAIDMGLTRTLLRNRTGKLEVVTAAAGSREGQPITAAVLDETHLWTRTNRGRMLYATIMRNLSKMGGRGLATTNAYDPGSESVAEQIELAAKKRPGIMLYGPQYESEVQDLNDLVALRRGLEHTYRDAPWVDIDRIMEDCQDPDIKPEDIHRFHLNVNRSSDSALCDFPYVSEIELEPGSSIAVGFDGSRNRDATAVVVEHMTSGVAYLAGYWERPLGLPKNSDWEVPRGEVLQVFDKLFSQYKVVRFKYDPAKWGDELASLANSYGADVVDKMPVWQSAVVDAALDATQESLRNRKLQIGGEGDSLGILRAQVQRARISRRMIGQRIIRGLIKPDDGGKIDAAAALVYCHQGKLEALKAGWTPAAAVEAIVIFR